MSERLAVLLHGPSAVGKTEAATILLARLGLPANALVVLDRGWAPGETRYSGGPCRYADLRLQSSAPVLVMELGCGEPADESRPGATRDAAEWRKVLEDDGRRLYAFLLWATRAATEQRARKRGPSGAPLISPWGALWYDLYAAGNERVTFPPAAGIEEARIETTNLTPDQVAEEILRTIGLA